MPKSLCLCWVLVFSCVAVAQTAGKVERVLPAGFIVHERQTAEAKPADPVAWNDVLRTNDKGRMRVALADGSVLSLGAKGEMRVVKHDTESQQTVIELLYGKARANVAPLTKPNSSFQVRTPTAVIGAIGTSAVIETMSSSPVTTISSEELERLPGTRSIQSLLDLKPGTMPPPKSSGTPPAGRDPSLLDYRDVESTRVVAIDHVTGVRSIDPDILKTVYLLPGEYTDVLRGQPPTDPKPFQSWGDLRMGDLDPPYRTQAGNDCVAGMVVDGIIVSATDPSLVGKPIEYLMTGRGTGSTGNVLMLKAFNPTECAMDFLVTEGAVFLPEQLTGPLGKLTASDFQHMMGFGGGYDVDVSSFGTPLRFFTAPPEGVLEVPLRAYCLEREKLAPHPSTKYRFASPEQKKPFAHNREFISRAHQMFLDGALTPTQPLDLIIQWAIWTEETRLDEKRFREAHTKLVEKTLKEQGRKFDKEMKARVEAAQTDIWSNVQKLLAKK